VVHREIDEFWSRLHALWLGHEADLRAEVGDRATGNVILEATLTQQGAEARPPTALLVLRRPAGTASAGAR
jgi:hypothetical protein